ncbi:MAG TPA: PUA domain-containing protein [Pyrinomonadaceae bacterium]|jgi:predicted amidohydrolase|nr:PUA domain-containing protein [Pyrinomonadaceae bacterium]
MTYSVETVDLKQTKELECRAMICQFHFEEFDWQKKTGLTFLTYNDKISKKISTFLQIAKQNSVDLVLLPELSVPEKLVEKIRLWSQEHNAIVVCGSHYFENADGYTSRCPVIVSGSNYFTEKIMPSPFEKSPIVGEGLNSGNKIIKISNSQFGNIGVLICSDYLDEDLKKNLDLESLDILCIPAFQNNSDFYHRRMATDCENSKNGIYILYSNFVHPKSGDGRSALFGTMDNIFSEKLQEREFTDLDPAKKLFEFKKDIEYLIVDIDLQNKRPFINRNISTEPNVRIVSTDIAPLSKDADFLQKISHDDERYKGIDEYYVAPTEYEEIIDSLEKHNLVFIIGDPGIGKTYTAVKILKDFYEKGFEPIWFAGLEKEDRNVQSRVLSQFTPESKQIVYFEDPFGRTVFERRDALFQVFSPLLDKLSQLDSKIIITSRKEIFERFSQESLLETEVLELKKELNVRRPSYDASRLVLIFKKLASSFCEWFANIEFRKLVYHAIESKKLTTPLAIRDLVFGSRSITSIEELEDRIVRRKHEIVKVFALEIHELTTPAKVFLYIVFLSGYKGHGILASMFLEILKELRALGIEANAYSFNIELRAQLGYRVEQLGSVRTAYRLSHPVYEEALAKLIFSDDKAETIVKLIIQEHAKINTNQAYRIINRIVVKYPKVALLLFRYLLENNLKLSNDDLRASVSQKLVSIYFLTRQTEFFDLALLVYPFKDLVDDINKGGDDDRGLSNKLNLVKVYKLNSPLGFDSSYSKKIDWNRVFNTINSHPTLAGTLLYYLFICVSINPKSIATFVEKRSSISLQRVYFYLDKRDRERFEQLLGNFGLKKEIRKYSDQISELEKQYGKGKKNRKLFINILFADRKYFGKLTIDKGAENAFKDAWRNLLPAGIVNVTGEFGAGSVVAIVTEDDKILGVGVTEYSAKDLRIIMKHSSNEFQELLGFFHSVAAVKREFLNIFVDDKTASQEWQFEPK